jgi:hypothetical protein
MKIKPNNQNSFDLLLNFTTQVSHHDPATGDGSNTLTFNRQAQIVQRDVAAYQLSQERVAVFCKSNPVPIELQPIFEQSSFTEFSAGALIRLLLDIYNSRDGVGVFSGMDRYEKLESRIRSAATRSFSLRGFWSKLCHDLRLPVHGGDNDSSLLAFYALPRGLQQDILSLMVREYRSVVMLARAWHTTGKLTNDWYAAKLNAEVQQLVTMNFDAALVGGESHEFLPLDAPAVTANSLRHQIVRESGWVHLVKSLGLVKVPAGVEALFVNGGNIRAGAKQPSNAAQLALTMRETYPLLDLLGGVSDSFDLNESRLSLAGWVVCRENADALKGTSAENLPLASVSIFDMLDDVTHTRQATEDGLGQMIWNFETLAKGLNIMVRMNLHPFTSDLTKSALFAVVEQFREQPTIAGQSARGFGWCNANWMNDVKADPQPYNEYLMANHDALVEGIASGKMGTTAQVCT